MFISFLAAAVLIRAEIQIAPVTDQAQPAQSAQEKRHQEDIKNDIEVGKKYSEQVEKELKLSDNKDMIERIQRIGDQLSKIANSQPIKASWGDKRQNVFPYSFKVLQGDDVNAFSLPGGYLYFYEGLLNFVESDDELAAVVGHEICHSAFRHLATIEREQSKFQLTQIPLILAAILSGGRVGSEFLQLGSLVGAALNSGWSVKAEQASDYGAYQILKRSSYNPVGMLTFMERLAKKDRTVEGTIDWGIYRTHPPGRERAEAMVKRLKEGGIPVRRSLVSTSFRVTSREGASGSTEAVFAGKRIAVFGGIDGKARADIAISKLNEYFDQVPAMFEIKIDGNKIVGGRQVLFTVTPEDADAAKTGPQELLAESLQAIKRAVYTISYRVWDSR